MQVTSIVLAAGIGLRLKSKLPKPLVRINSLPLVSYSLKAFNSCRYVKDIIVAVNPANKGEIRRLIKKLKLNKVTQVVIGGSRRQDSVSNCLKALSGKTGLILIHDAARPFIEKNSLAAVIKEAGISGAAILAVPVKATIKKVPAKKTGGFAKNYGEKSKLLVSETIDRSNLWEVQTPQVFKSSLILEAYRRFGKNDVTDDAMLVEKLGAKVSVVMGSYFNIKITTPEDLAIAEAILKDKFKKRN